MLYAFGANSPAATAARPIASAALYGRGRGSNVNEKLTADSEIDIRLGDEKSGEYTEIELDIIEVE